MKIWSEIGEIFHEVFFEKKKDNIRVDFPCPLTREILDPPLH